MIVEVLDIGSNSIKCLIADKREKSFNCLTDIRIPFRLGSYLTKKGYISELGQNKAIYVLNCLQLDIERAYKVEEIIAAGTETFRRASNRKEFVRRIYIQDCLEVKILTPKQEAKLEWKGVLSGLPNPLQPITVFDSGGFSTEIISGRGGHIQSSQSFPLGALQLTKQFVKSDPISTKDYNNLLFYINGVLPVSIVTKDTLIGTGGGALVCACVASKGKIKTPQQAEGYEITLAELQRQIELYKQTDLKQRENIAGMEKERADIMLAAVLLFSALLKKSGKDRFRVSTRGLRHGMLTMPKWYVCPI
ncbi:MAG TPA: exopolyphosphatase [Candidatus Cloacimonas sp.]|jgi:exopolyphosphatase/guanosine-5'-triphosphate,3'-diphosphate pyrophosphatase|nr:exopolyphosphatase [Candidatus Cloacimonas sp.]